MNSKKDIGKMGELTAELFLQAKGFKTLERNYRFKKSEIDLIVKKDNWLVFVEVRLRNSIQYGYPEQTISAAKKKKIMEGAANYLEISDWKGNVRYDVIAIYKDEVTHLEDAFY